VDHDPRVGLILGVAHLDRELELVAEYARLAERFASVAVGVLALAEELRERVELVLELVERLRRLELALVAPDLAKDVLGLLGPGPEIRSGRLLPQSVERAPRSVEIKGSPGAKRAAPRRR
jgi:hypothetical protein